MKTTKSKLLAVLALALSLAGATQGQTNSYSINVNAPIIDGNPVGQTSVTNLSGLSGSISNVEVTLDITGGFNGDLYAYLVSPSGQMLVLLNRVGVGTGNAIGYSDAGFNIILSDSGAHNIHNYQNYGIPTGQLTGTWAADGRAILPNSAPSAFDASPTTDFSLFNNANPNGVWTLFIADLGGGSQSTLVSWGLTIVTVPEPQTWLLGLSGGAALLFAINRRRKV